MSLTHLQFADDTIIFCNADWDEMLVFKKILRCFEVMSGLKINFHKSVVCGVGVEDKFMDGFAGLLKCRKQKLPISYLGLPLGTSPRLKVTWSPVIDKIKKKLALWKRRLLSFGSRLTLVRLPTNCNCVNLAIEN